METSGIYYPGINEMFSNGQNIVDSDGRAGKVEEGGDYNDREYGQDYQGRLPNVSHESLLEDLSIDNFLRTLPRPYQLLQT